MIVLLPMYQLTLAEIILNYLRLASNLLFKVILILLAGVVIFSLIALKAFTTPQFRLEPLLYAYTLLVTIFALSRLTSALLYRSSINEIYKQAKKFWYEPTVTFIIPCKNEENAIQNTVTTCFRADYPAHKLEVIVINDASTDNTAQKLEELKPFYSKLKVISFAKNRGKREAMAEGIAQAQGEIIIQLDSDSHIDPQTFRNLITPFALEDIAAVCAHADPANANKNFVTKMQSAYYYMSFKILKAAESTFMSVFCASGCSSAYRKSAIMPVINDWLNESFLGQKVTWGDDRALTSQLLKRGHKTIYTDRVQAYTIVPENFKILVRQQIRWKKSWIINSLFTAKFIMKTNPFVGLLYFTPMMIISFLTPFIAFKALVLTPLLFHTFPLHYIFGVFLMTTLFALPIIYLNPKNKSWPYLFPWAFLNMIMFSFLIIYSALRIQDRKWGTR